MTLVQEQAAWFPDKKGAKLVLPVSVFEGSEVNADAAADTQRSEKTAKPKPQSADARNALFERRHGSPDNSENQ
jgi:hypothetical protein